MDIPRKSQKGKRILRRTIWGGLLLGLVSAGTVGLSRLEPAAPGVERETRTSDYDTVLLACATYLQATRAEFHHQRWKQWLE